MKIALLFLAVLPVVFSTAVDNKRFIENLLGGYDAVELGKQLLCQFGADETEQQCEDKFCPALLAEAGLDDISPLLSGPLCALTCEEAQALANEYACPE